MSNQILENSFHKPVKFFITTLEFAKLAPPTTDVQMKKFWDSARRLTSQLSQEVRLGPSALVFEGAAFLHSDSSLSGPCAWAKFKGDPKTLNHLWAVRQLTAIPGLIIVPEHLRGGDYGHLLLRVNDDDRTDTQVVVQAARDAYVHKIDNRPVPSNMHMVNDSIKVEYLLGGKALAKDDDIIKSMSRPSLTLEVDIAHFHVRGRDETFPMADQHFRGWVSHQSFVGGGETRGYAPFISLASLLEASNRHHASLATQFRTYASIVGPSSVTSYCELPETAVAVPRRTVAVPAAGPGPSTAVQGTSKAFQGTPRAFEGTSKAAKKRREKRLRDEEQQRENERRRADERRVYERRREYEQGQEDEEDVKPLVSPGGTLINLQDTLTVLCRFCPR